MRGTQSVWTAHFESELYTPLEADIGADVCVIGGGIAGLTCAYQLSRKGADVVLIDAGAIASGESSRTTAQINTGHDNGWLEMEKLHGQAATKLCAESYRVCLDTIKAIIDREGIDCGFERLNGYLFLPPGRDVEELYDELQAAHRAGLTEVDLVASAPLKKFHTGPALRYPKQAQFHPLAYLRGLSKALRKNGGKIFANTRATDLLSGTPNRVKTQAGPTVSAKSVVVATNTPFHTRVAMHTKLSAFRTYVIGLHIEKGSVENAQYWDYDDPYHYARLATIAHKFSPRTALEKETDILLVGGEDHKTGQNSTPLASFDCLEKWAAERFPKGEVVYRWSGQVMETIDGMPFAGPFGSDNIYVITGDSGTGMTHCTLGALLVADQIQGEHLPWEKLFAADRKDFAAAKDFLKQNANAAAQYGDWLHVGKDQIPLSELPNDCGTVVRHGIHPAAVYRDTSGVCHEMSAVCPHLGGLVRWNEAERSWDCPCHGSRFDAHGVLLHGPAHSDLKKH